MKNKTGQKKFHFTVGFVLLLIAALAVAAAVAVTISRDESTQEAPAAGDDVDDAQAAKEELTRASFPLLEIGTDVYALEDEILKITIYENVAVTTDTYSGSGFVWKEDESGIWIATAAHVLADETGGTLQMVSVAFAWTDVAFSGEDVVTVDGYDLAFIHLSAETAETLLYIPLSAYTAGDMQTGDDLWIVDSIYGSGTGISSATVANPLIYFEDYEAELLYIYGAGKEGMSGSPAYDAEGLLAGMICGMSEDGTELAAVPVQVLKEQNPVSE
ncbi:MAG: serine protease [Lachnospiraceae bacterium]|nr:serine protease [Lachnospiraceae bacterium]